MEGRGCLRADDPEVDGSTPTSYNMIFCIEHSSRMLGACRHVAKIQTTATRNFLHASACGTQHWRIQRTEFFELF